VAGVNRKLSPAERAEIMRHADYAQTQLLACIRELIRERGWSAYDETHESVLESYRYLWQRSNDGVMLTDALAILVEINDLLDKIPKPPETAPGIH
jgi:hypothetical protein